MALNPAESLLLEHLAPNEDTRILVLEGGEGWLAAEAAVMVPKGYVLSLSRDARDVWNCQENLAFVPNASTGTSVFPESNYWDIALLVIPKERRYTRTLLLSAWGSLKNGGRLHLAGPNRVGAKAVIKDAERLFGNSAVLGYRSHHRVAACTKNVPLPDPLPVEFQQPGVAPGTTHFITVYRPERKLTLETHPGIFSWGALDAGTQILLDHLKINPGERVWDVGCGYGVIGLSCALSGASHVTMSDINLLAVSFAQANSRHNGLAATANAFPADGLNPISIGLPSPVPLKHDPLVLTSYDLVVTNPAFHQGHQVNTSMADQLIKQAPSILSANGRLIIVANRFLNYDKFMSKHFNRVDRIAETKKFHVLVGANL